jgi:site-specific DNA-methyltransferase (adenine-specific)
MNIDLRHGDCRTVMATMEPESVDAIVSDPPYGLGFMGKEWDHGVPGVTFWVEALRVAKPGAHLLAFGGTRTFHRLACAIEDAGWEIRDCIMWVYGSGFPKSHNVSKAIDKAAGAQREIIGQSTKPSTEEAKQWDGYGTALKPAWEPIIVARKPLIGTVAENVLRYGTGAINVDACRIAHDDKIWQSKSARLIFGGINGTANGWEDRWKFGPEAMARRKERYSVAMAKANELGRWPANVVHDGSDDVVGLFPVLREYGGDTNSAARFFYCAKTSNRDRNDGCDNPHPTVKPTDLMTWLCKLVTPPNGVVLDPFCGSGSTGRGAMHAGAVQFIGIDISEDYLEIARRRIEAARHPMDSLLS